jgi:hypothetical protein
VGDSYSQQLTASGGSGSGYTFAATTLPAGLTLSASGLLSGTPIGASGAVFTVDVTATDGDGDTGSEDYLLTVKNATQSGVINSSSPEILYGQYTTLTATFSATGIGLAPMTGRVAFYDGTTYLGTAPLVLTVNQTIGSVAVSTATAPNSVSGQATLAENSLGVGDHVITAVYSGDVIYSSATSAIAVSLQVAPATTNSQLTAVTTPLGTTLTDDVVMTSTGNPPVGGTVTFYNDNTLLGVAPLSNGVATWNAGLLSVGQHTFRADFSGGATSEGSASVATVSTDGPRVVGLSRYGFGSEPTVISLNFDQPLDPASAENVANYQLLDGRGHQILIVAAQYDPATLTVTLRLQRRLPLHRVYTLSVVGTGPNSLATSSGLPLDGSGRGQPGTNFVTKVTWRALTLPGSPPAVTFDDGQAHTYHGAFGPYFGAITRATRTALHSIAKSAAVTRILAPQHVTAQRERPADRLVGRASQLTRAKLGVGLGGRASHAQLRGD